ncbi:MAG: hypothetical protein E4G89_07265 [Methanothrix sp.]|nr:MAG: hypothetical protein E4G89_07265 [Methanothrix sp.]
MGEPIDSKKLEEIGNSAEALILTEWKIAKEKKDRQEQIDQGIKQAKSYSRGCLGGFELRDYRYIVLVTSESFTPPPASAEDGIEYKVINLAVEPAVPSRNRGGK